jgi:hypothetical protein
MVRVTGGFERDVFGQLKHQVMGFIQLIADLEFVKTFMLTYEDITSPRNLFKLLIRRYFMEPPAGCEGADREEWTKSVQVQALLATAQHASFD